jgi:hypothetical protein
MENNPEGVEQKTNASVSFTNRNVCCKEMVRETRAMALGNASLSISANTRKQN